MVFRDRQEAGRLLARALEAYRGRQDVLVLGLPRGGVPVAAEVARALGAPLDVLVVRKLGVPGFQEVALGAVASGGGVVLNDSICEQVHLTPKVLNELVGRELEELHRRERAYRGERPPLELAGKVAIVVDDGLATGATMRAAAGALRALGPARIVVAVPVGAPPAVEAVRRSANQVVCLHAPEDFLSVGGYYDDFAQLTDREVQRLLAPGPVR